jgi:hypothetical protein
MQLERERHSVKVIWVRSGLNLSSVNSKELLLKVELTFLGQIPAQLTLAPKQYHESGLFTKKVVREKESYSRRRQFARNKVVCDDEGCL